MTAEEMFRRAEGLDNLADNEDDEIEYYRLRAEAAEMYRKADEARFDDFDEDEAKS